MLFPIRWSIPSFEMRSIVPLLLYKEMAGMRDVIIHEYDEIDLDEVWGTIARDIPGALEKIDRLLEGKKF
ncbi:DUF86 domain-containing protein [Candidatus Peregrinibacteria bacterium]|nr:DUF86 domain-containing protein [Candidatus Peregrinibacteria bacterium]